MSLRLRWRVRELLDKSPMRSYQDLGDALATHGYSISRVAVMKLVRHSPKRLSIDALVALCGVFDCRIEDLFEQTWTNDAEHDADMFFPMPPALELTDV